MIDDIEIINPEKMNEFQMIQVMDDLKAKGITRYTMRPGNECIWVTFNSIIDCYYIFNAGELVDIQFD